MCLGIPMQIERIDGLIARCQAKGISRDVNLTLMQGTDLHLGDFVMVHVGYAIERIDDQVARTAWETYDAMVGGPDEHA